MLGRNTLEKDDGEGLSLRRRTNRKERVRESVRIWIAILLTLILCCNNNGEIFGWYEIMTMSRVDSINDLWVSIILLVKFWNLVLQTGYGMGMRTGFWEQVHNSLNYCNKMSYSILRHLLWLRLSLVGKCQDVMIRLEFVGYTTVCFVFVGIFMESLVRCWAEDKGRIFTVGGRGFFEGKLLLGILNQFILAQRRNINIVIYENSKLEL